MARQRQPIFVCPDCKKRCPKETPRVTVKGWTTCGDCAYKREIRADALTVRVHRELRKPSADQLTIDEARTG